MNSIIQVKVSNTYDCKSGGAEGFPALPDLSEHGAERYNPEGPNEGFVILPE
jgi:hypothetical protein